MIPNEARCLLGVSGRHSSSKLESCYQAALTQWTRRFRTATNQADRQRASEMLKSLKQARACLLTQLNPIGRAAVRQSSIPIPKPLTPSSVSPAPKTVAKAKQPAPRGPATLLNRVLGLIRLVFFYIRVAVSLLLSILALWFAIHVMAYIHSLDDESRSSHPHKSRDANHKAGKVNQALP